MSDAPVSQLTRINVLLTAEEAERFSFYCAREGFKKSTLIARLVRDFLDSEAVVLPPRKRRAKAKEDAADKEDAA